MARERREQNGRGRRVLCAMGRHRDAHMAGTHLCCIDCGHCAWRRPSRWHYAETVLTIRRKQCLL